MFQNILIPTDGSKFSEKVVKDGVALAKTFKAKITGVHVVENVVVYSTDDLTFDAEMLRRMEETNRKAGQRYLRRLENAAQTDGVPFESVLLERSAPWEGIIEAAEKHRCDLIVMAAHGRAGIKGLLLGSQTNKVLTHSKIPVLVYR